jgi:hypothetical protein
MPSRREMKRRDGGLTPGRPAGSRRLHEVDLTGARGRGHSSGTEPTEGIIHRRSPFPVAETLDRLTERVSAAGATLFALVDHSGEAAKVGLSLRNTKLLVFGNRRPGRR